jgi:uncharacterized protein (TIGR02271 family)
MERSTFGHVTDWNEVIKKEARGRNDADLGEVLDVRDDIVVTERGTLNKEKFYLPKSIPHGFNGHILLFDITEEEAKERFTNESALKQGTEIQSTATSTTAVTDIERPIPVIEEKLEVSKKETIQEAKIIKEPKIEFKTVEVELTYEELIIEKRPVDKTSSSPSTSEEIAQSKTEIIIPLKKEDLVVEKKPYVKEEIVLKKKQVSETKTISEQLISEKVSVRNHEGEEVREKKWGEKQQEE